MHLYSLVFGNLYFHCSFPAFILKQTGHINCLELLTIVLALKIWGNHFKGKKLIIYCDNSSSVFAINSGVVKDEFMLACLREICYLCMFFDFQLRAIHIPGVDNRLPDLLSRWELHPKFREEFFRRTRLQVMVENSCPVEYFNWSCNW